MLRIGNMDLKCLIAKYLRTCFTKCKYNYYCILSEMNPIVSSQYSSVVIDIYLMQSNR